MGKSNAQLTAEIKAANDKLKAYEEAESTPELEMAEKLAEANAKVKELEEVAKAATVDPKAVNSVAEYLNEKVQFYAIKDNDKYKDDIVLTHNGKNWKIQRGVRVMVPRYLYNELMDSERQKKIAADTSQGFVDKFNSVQAQLI